ncbi:hypothetical protein BU23DRAFT_578826 [Bimuria novae-zelandiae CBS 107.79]|uniref:Nephrocystin 3-like N-terminal domain-containing protein n=1 Tax=Bimuria novae-zelandiae CBS 107.79 TaxID=1447943 RepID=A0A6A5VJW2_9PLEO|nr:hypothetical protein BU23DRAFT_578826 [Bimuria novae-zelandiae CBS 107.79]
MGLTVEEQTSNRTLYDRSAQAIQCTLLLQTRLASHCDSVASLLENLKMANRKDQQDGGLSTRCERRFTVLVRRLEAYFDFLSVHIPVKSEWRQKLWELILLLFKTANSYIALLEKVADLFESIGNLLPDYAELQAVYTRPKHSEHRHHEARSRLLSPVYSELAQFLIGIHLMFCRVSHGVASRHYRLPSPAPFWRPLDSRFAQLEVRLLQHRQWIETEFGQNEEDYATVLKHRSKYTDFLNRQVEAGESDESKQQRMAKRMRRVDRVKTWLGNSCSYRDAYVHRLNQRHPNTCAWFLSEEKYCRWRNVPFDTETANDTEHLETGWQHRVLFVQAESGFGKSFLSGAVIDDLSTEASNLSIDDEHEPPSTVFYHFNAAHSYCIHPDDAFRALTDQLLDLHRRHRSTLDAVSLLVRKATTRAKATSEEVLSILALLLHQHPTFLVIDGIDECSDVDLLLRSISELCRKTDTRVILFSRPHLKIPNEYHKWASDAPHLLSLSRESNKHDVEVYVTENFHELANQGYFGISMDRSLITMIAQRCHGNFLWASSLLKYLRSPVLSPDERRSKLERPHELDGLEMIYARILGLLEFSSEPEKRFVASVFRLLTFGIHNPCMRGFQKALNVVPGQRTIDSGANFITNEKIPFLTCGLVEVTSCNIIFTHKSVREYLLTVDPQTSFFGLRDESLAHAHLAATTISFLAFDIPKRSFGNRTPQVLQPRPAPHEQSSATSMRTSKSSDSEYKSMNSAASTSEPYLSPPGRITTPSSSTPAISQPEWDADLPFLRYASLCWPIHLTRALQNPSSHVNPAVQYPWLTSLSTFLTDRAAVTTWVEASWRYNLPPNLSRLVPLLEAVKQRTPPATVEGRELSDGFHVEECWDNVA